MQEVVRQVRLRLLAGHIYAASKLGMWGFVEDFQLYQCLSKRISASA